MTSCANITLERVRARISFGTPGGPNSLTFETPDVKSFSVSRSRSTLANSFSASIEMPANLAIPAGEDVIIEAGTVGNLQRIFTGQVTSITVNPSFENASRYILNISGQDRFRELEGKNISRRQRARGLSSFAAITGVSARAPQKGLSYEKRSQSGGAVQFLNQDTNIREHSRVVRTDRIGFDPYEPAKDPESVESVASENAFAGGGELIEIKPRTSYLGIGVSVIMNLENETYEAGDTWGVTDPSIGRIVDRQDGTAIYTQLAIGENTVTFTKGDGSATFVGKATAHGIMIHDHSSLGQGGPAFGVFSSD